MKISPKTVRTLVHIVDPSGRERVRFAFLWLIDKYIGDYENGYVVGDEDDNQKHVQTLQLQREAVASAKNVSEMLGALTGNVGGEDSGWLFELEAEDFFPILLAVAGELEK